MLVLAVDGPGGWNHDVSGGPLLTARQEELSVEDVVREDVIPEDEKTSEDKKKRRNSLIMIGDLNIQPTALFWLYSFLIRASEQSRVIHTIWSGWTEGDGFTAIIASFTKCQHVPSFRI